MNTFKKQLLATCILFSLATIGSAENAQSNYHDWPMGMQIAYQGDQALAGIQNQMPDEISATLAMLMQSSVPLADISLQMQDESASAPRWVASVQSSQ